MYMKILFQVHHYTIKANIIRYYLMTKLYSIETLEPKLWICSSPHISKSYTKFDIVYIYIYIFKYCFSRFSWTHLGILGCLNNAVICLVSILPVSYTSSTFSNPFGAVPSILTTIGITVTRIFQKNSYYYYY